MLSVTTPDGLIEALKQIGTEEDVRRLEEYKARYRASE